MPRPSPRAPHLRRTIAGLAAGLAILAIGTCRADGQAEGHPDRLARLAAGDVRLHTLENGLTVLLRADPSAPVVSVQVWIGVGSIHEQEYLGAGLSHAIEHMIFKGNTNLPVGALTRLIHESGGAINAYTTFDRTVFHVDMPARAFTNALTVLAEAVIRPEFPVAEWVKERDVILRELAMNLDDPGRMLGQQLWRTAYRVHPHRVPVIGYAAAFSALTRDDLALFARRHYVPDNAMIVAVGDFDADQALAEITRRFGAMPRRARAPVVLPTEPPQIAPRRLRETGAYRITRVALAYHTVALTDPDAPVLDVLADIVGQGESAALVREIREQRALAQSVVAWSYTPREPGLFGISAECDPAQEAALVEALESAVSDWGTTEFAAADVQRAIRRVLTHELGELESAHGQARAYASGWFYTGDQGFARTYLARIERVTAADLRRVAARYLQPANRSLVILAPTGGVADAVAPATTATAPADSALHRAVTPSGATLLSRYDPTTPFVYVCAAFQGGLLHEPPAQAGATRLMADCLPRGAGAQDREAVARAIENRGATLTPFSGMNSWGVQLRCLPEDAEAMAALAAELLSAPRFDPAEVASQRRLQLGELAAQEESPMYQAQHALMELLFPNHPYRLTPPGTPETVRTLEQVQLQRLHARLAVASNAVVVVVAPLPPAEATAIARRCVERLPTGPRPMAAVGMDAPPAGRTKRRLPREQTIILAGARTVPVTDPDHDALEMLAALMSGLSSELNTQIREKRGLAYYAGAYQQAGIQPGAFVVYAGTRADAAGAVEGLMLDECRRLAETGPGGDEFDRVRARLLGAHDMALQDRADLAQRCALNELYGLGAEHVFRRPDRLRALSPAALRAAAERHLAPARVSLSLVLPRGEDTTTPTLSNQPTEDNP